MIDELVEADGEISADERASVNEIKKAIQDANVGVLGSMGNFLGGSVNRRTKAVTDAPNRELYMDDYVKNKVYYSVSRRMELEETEIDVSETELRRQPPLFRFPCSVARSASTDPAFHERKLST